MTSWEGVAMLGGQIPHNEDVLSDSHWRRADKRGGWVREQLPEYIYHLKRCSFVIE